MRSQLLCTFTDRKNLNTVVDYLKGYYRVYNDKLYVFSNEDSPRDLILSYNAIDSLRDGLPHSTILIHRKKDTNTLYTINALNIIIKKVNNGILDKSYQLDWSLYQNSLLVVDNQKQEEDYKVISLFFEKIIRI